MTSYLKHDLCASVVIERERRKRTERLLMVSEPEHDDFSALLGHGLQENSVQRRGVVSIAIVLRDWIKVNASSELRPTARATGGPL